MTYDNGGVLPAGITTVRMQPSETILTSGQVQALLDADRDSIDAADAAVRPAHDPDVAAGQGDYNHTDHIGEPAGDDDATAAAVRQAGDRS